MDKRQLELYTDYLISNYGYATATGLSAMVNGAVSHDKITRFLAEREYTSKDLWREVKSAVRQIESGDGVLIFDDTISEKTWTDENEVVCWHYDHTKGRLVKGINLLNALKKNGRFVRIDRVSLPEKQAVHGWLKGYDKEVLLVRQVFTNQGFP